MAHRSRNLSANWGILAGAGGGILGGLFGTSGPPFVAYLAYKLKEKEALRASLIGMFAVDYSWRTLVFACSGLLTADLLFFGLCLIPALVLGTILGHKIHVRITERQFRRIVAGILFGPNVPFVGEIVKNLTGLLAILGENGLVGLIALSIILYLFQRRRADA